VYSLFNVIEHIYLAVHIYFNLIYGEEYNAMTLYGTVTVKT
jgi:hypothetical protein